MGNVSRLNTKLAKSASLAELAISCHERDNRTQLESEIKHLKFLLFVRVQCNFILLNLFRQVRQHVFWPGNDSVLIVWY